MTQSELIADTIPQPQELPSETPIPATHPGASYLLARRLSQLFHPMISTTLSFLIVGIFSSPQRLVGLGWAVLSILLQVVPPTVFYAIRLHQGAYSDEEVSVRHQRNELYFFTLVSVFIGIGVLTTINAPLPLIALLISGALMNITNWVINTVWKISVHASTAAMCATIGMIHSVPLGLLLWLCSLALGWSRVRTRNHTPLQVVAGMGVASLLTILVFSASGLL